jgi:ribose transport system permease protein
MALMEDQLQEGAPVGVPSLPFWSRQTQTKVVNGLLDYGVLLVLVALFIYFSIASPYFLSVHNLLNIGYAASITGILAVGITIALIAGQLDLSIGAIVGLSTVIIATAQVNHGLPYSVAIALAVGAALIVGLINGFLVVNVGINSIIVTLATLGVATAAAEVISAGQTISLRDISLTGVVNAQAFGVPVTVILMVLAYIAAYVLLIQTRLGWHIYAAGGNPSAAQRAGIRVGGVYRFVFLLTAGLSVIGGIVITGRAASGGANYGETLGIEVLTAVLLGGIGLGGGSGRIERTLVGVLLLQILDNGLVLTNVTSYYQQAVVGVIFVAAVVMAAVRSKRMSR